MSISFSAKVAAVPFAREERTREGRLQLALLRSVLDNLKPNRVMIPIFAAAICAMFSPFVSVGTLALWFGLVMLSLLPQHFVTRMVPNNPAMSPDEVKQWLRIGSAANLLHIICWTSLGWLLWVPGNDFNHLLIQLVLATSLSAHAAMVDRPPLSGPC